MVFAAGSIVGPILGGFLDDKVGFKDTTILISACAAAFSMLYFSIVFCNCGSNKKVD